jgi:hypothetical protein
MLGKLGIVYILLTCTVHKISKSELLWVEKDVTGTVCYPEINLEGFRKP